MNKHSAMVETRHGAAPTQADVDMHGTALIDALSESRNRWRDIASMAFDLVFETDAEGCFVFITPEDALGWPAGQLLGQASETLLIQPGNLAGFNPFRAQQPVRRHRTSLRRADGRPAVVLVSATPVLAPDGRVVGARGAVQDISEQDRRDAGLVDTLLRRQTMEEIARRMRRAVLPDMVIKIGLEELLDATGSLGAAIIGCDGASPTPGAHDAATRPMPRILHRTSGMPPAPDVELVAHAVRAASLTTAPWTLTETRFDTRLIMSAIGTHFCEPVVLMLWRDSSHGWISGDAELASTFMSTLGGVLEHDEVQRELARRSGADALTGLLNRKSFTSEVNRRLDRLDREGLAATLMVVGLDRFRELNDSLGPESGDEVLRQAAHILRDAVRPTDLVARLGNDVFALWLDGADQFTAAERAELMCQNGIAVTIDEPKQLRVSVGLATRPSRSYETIDAMLEQAQAALGAIKLAGGGRWHFYNEGTGA